MKGGGKPPKRDRFRALLEWKRKEKPSPTPQTATATPLNPSHTSQERCPTPQNESASPQNVSSTSQERFPTPQNESTPPQTVSSTPPQIPNTGPTAAISAPPVQDRSGDSQRATTRYLEAARALEKVVKGCKSEWGSFDFPELKGEPINPTDLHFKHKIDTVLEARKGALKNQTAWKKCKHTIQCIFSALSPFAKNFLTIAQSVQSSVSHFSNLLRSIY
jgi:hypothetical protein